MSYKVLLWDALSPIGWSQAQWRRETTTATVIPPEAELASDVILRHLPRGVLVLDAGCGTGKWPILLRRHGWRAVGVEISADACALARRDDPELPLLRADARLAPVRTAAVDAVLSLGVVEHDERGPEEGLRELRRMLRPGGTLVLAVPFDNWWRRLVANPLLTFVTARRRRQQQRLGFVEYRFTVRELHRLLRATGFTPVAAHPNDYRPPHVMGLWVDFTNITAHPLRPSEGAQFVLPGWRGRIARLLLDHVPWLVCGEIIVVARAS